MKHCLWCQEEFNPKKESALYCCDSCRVMAYQDRKKKGLLKKEAFVQDQLSEVLTQMKAVLASIPTQFDGPKLPDNFMGDEPLSFGRLKQEMAQKGSYATFEQALRKAETLQELEKVGQDIKKSELLWKEKRDLENLGKQIAADKFNF